MNKDLLDIINSISWFIENNYDIEANQSTPLLGKNSAISSLSVMELVAWCEDTYNIRNLLEDDLFLDSLASVYTLSERILLLKGGNL